MASLPGTAARAFKNTYQEAQRAAAYDELSYDGTYRLVFDNLPAILREQVTGVRALDFGCGTGRSARFLGSLGFDTVSVDISEEMVRRARQRDPGGDYRVISDGDFHTLEPSSFDLILSAFTFDNIPGGERKVGLFRALGDLLAENGRMVNIVSTAEMYTHEWVTFSTCEYPENAAAAPGDVVRVVTLDYSDRRPVDDIFWPHDSYVAVYGKAGLRQLLVERPLATGREGVAWKGELQVAPWAIYVLERA